MGSLVAVASTRPRDPATGRFISAEAAARLSVPAASPVVTEPAPDPTKDKKKQGKQQQDKKKSKNKKSSKKKSDKKEEEEENEEGLSRPLTPKTACAPEAAPMNYGRVEGHLVRR